MSSDDLAKPLVYPEPPDYLRKGRFFGAFRVFGPGAIIASVTIGSGETIFPSRAGAIFGYSLLWFILFCAACKLVQVHTAARYMILTGEHPMEAWARFPGPRGWFPLLIGALSVLCFPFWIGGLALMLGTAVNWMTGLDAVDAPTQLLYARLFGTGTLLLTISLTLVQTYAIFEKVQIAIVSLLVAAILAAVVVAPVDWGQAARSLIPSSFPTYPGWVYDKYPGIIERESVLLSLVIFMAAIGGGTYDYIGYLSFFRDKRWGALGPEEGRRAGTAAPAIEPTEANFRTGKQWVRAPTIDVFMGFACVLVFVIVFNVLGAAILHPNQEVPEGMKVLTPQVKFLTQIAAPLKYLYQAGILMTFLGTIYGAFEIYSRTVYECSRPLVAKVRRLPYGKFRLPVCLYIVIGGLALLWTVKDPVAIIKPIAPVAMLTCGIWCFAMIWTDRRMLPAPLRMGAVWMVLNVLAGVAMSGFGATAMWMQFA